MQFCLVEINRGNISAYRLSSNSLDKEIIYTKDIEYYTKINELLIMRYKRHIESVLNELFKIESIKVYKNNLKIRIILEESDEVLNGIKRVVKENNISNIEVVSRERYKRESYRLVKRKTLKVWEIGGSIYIGYYRQGISVVNEFINKFEIDKFKSRKDIARRLICFDIPVVKDVDIRVGDKVLKALMLESITTMGYN